MSHDEPRTPDEPIWDKGVSVHEWPTGAWDKVRAEARAALLAELREKVEALPQWDAGGFLMVRRAAVLALLDLLHDSEPA